MLNELTSNKWLVFPLFQLVFSSSLCTSQYSALIDHVFPQNMLRTYENIWKKWSSCDWSSTQRWWYSPKRSLLLLLQL